MTDQQRKVAMLTQNQRDFIRGDKAYEGDTAKQQRYQMRERIRRRVRDTLQDFALLYEYTDERERNAIFDVGESHADMDAVTDFQEALAATIAFLYRSLEGEPTSEAMYDRSFRVPFEAILQQGVAKAEVDRQPRTMPRTMVTVDFDVDVRRSSAIDIDHAIEKIAELRENELTDAEIRNLIFAFNPDVGFSEEGYAELATRVQDRRRELGIDTDPLSEDEKEQIREELSSDDSDEE